ncbi:MAG: amidase, partial [Gemmatimonadales bacterium]|nr:amidase [Gemmatimonadales bacterium]
DSALARADRLNPRLNAIIHRMDAKARARADAGAGSGPFAGVPFLIKDLIQLVEGEPFRCGSRFLADYVADHDSELVSRFRRAGLILIGKTNTPEFGLTPYTEPMLFGPSRNPWNPDLTTGGSSGGSAAAVAAGIVPVAGGGDGGGSIRIPASCCGIFGLKPTRGRTPMGPDFGQLWLGAAIDHGLTRSVRDSAALLDAIQGGDAGAPYLAPPPARPYLEEVGREPGRLRVAFTTKPWLGSSVHPDCVAAVADAARLLESLGHDVVEASPEFDGAGFARAFMTMVCAECAADVHDAGAVVGRKPTRAGFEPATWAIHLLGQALRADELSTALRFQGLVGRQVGRFFERFDLLLTPTLATPPFPIGSLQPKPAERVALELLGRMGSGRLIKVAGLLEQMAGEVFQAIPYTPLFNATGQPAMSVPLHWNAAGVPIGIQLVGRFADECTLFRVAGQLERARPWFDRIPPLD